TTATPGAGSAGSAWNRRRAKGAAVASTVGAGRPATAVARRHRHTARAAQSGRQGQWPDDIGRRARRRSAGTRRPGCRLTLVKTPMAPADPQVIFTPSGRRGRVAAGTTVLDAARSLGVDIDSVCGGRGICGRCAVTPAFGSFAKHGITSSPDHLTQPNAVETEYREVSSLADDRRLSCTACVLGDLVVDVPPESQVHRQVVRKE